MLRTVTHRIIVAAKYSALGADFVARARKDGYTLLLATAVRPFETPGARSP
jgi:hypothetical protein